MPAPIKQQTEFRLQVARGLSNEINLRDPSLWLAKVEELEQLAQQDERAAPRLVELLADYSRALQEGWYANVQNTDPDKSRHDFVPVPIYHDMVIAAHLALVSLGTKATEALLNAYQAAKLEDAQRLTLLKTLAETGDPALNDFFSQLAFEDIYPAYRRDAIETEEKIAQMPPDEKAIAEEAREFLESIRNTYFQAKVARTF